jgi:hypothetical protein
MSDGLVHTASDRQKINIQGTQKTNGNAFFFREDAKQYMFRPNVIMIMALRFIHCQGYDTSRPGGKSVKCVGHARVLVLQVDVTRDCTTIGC